MKNDMTTIPHDFVAYVMYESKPLRYVRNEFDNWDVFNWTGQWKFFDNVGEISAVEGFLNAVMVFEYCPNDLPPCMEK